MVSCRIASQREKILWRPGEPPALQNHIQTLHQTVSSCFSAPKTGRFPHSLYNLSPTTVKWEYVHAASGQTSWSSIHITWSKANRRVSSRECSSRKPSMEDNTGAGSPNRLQLRRLLTTVHISHVPVQVPLWHRLLPRGHLPWSTGVTIYWNIDKSWYSLLQYIIDAQNIDITFFLIFYIFLLKYAGTIY